MGGRVGIAAAFIASLLLHGLLLTLGPQAPTPLPPPAQTLTLELLNRQASPAHPISRPPPPSPTAPPSFAPMAAIPAPPALPPLLPWQPAALELDHYYGANELDTLAQTREIITLAFPDNVPEEIRAGMVQLQLDINELGGVDEVLILQAQPAGWFDQTARNAFLNTHWEAAMRQGQWVKSRKIIEVCFGDCSAIMLEPLSSQD